MKMADQAEGKFAPGAKKIKYLSELPKKLKKCAKVLSSADQRRHHVSAVHEKFRYHHGCPQCNFQSRNVSDLRVHVRAVHLGIKNHSCKHCSYKSGRRGDLPRHVKAVHLRVNDFACRQCEYKASQSSQLKAHAKSVHLDIKDQWTTIALSALISHQGPVS